MTTTAASSTRERATASASGPASRSRTANGFRARSRRGWAMAELVPELEQLPHGLMLDGELVSFDADGRPSFELLGRRMLMRDGRIPVCFLAFDLLAIDGTSTLHAVQRAARDPRSHRPRRPVLGLRCRIITAMFTAAERERVQRRLVELAESDGRIVAAALVGSLADGAADRWSDIDVSLGVDESFAVADVLDDWSRTMADEFDAVTLLDLPVRGTTYRVFLLDDWLQVDLSFSPASGFRQGSPKFKLLFGSHTTAYPPPESAHDVFGWGVVYARCARASIDRRKWWQAEHCVSALRESALTLACVHREIRTGYGRGFDDLPASVVAGLDDALVRSLDRDELLRALGRAIDGLLRQAHDVRDIAEKVEPQLRELLAVGPARD